ncbi:S ribonuclease [Pyrus ussuriensis x Pyrus communis]|uniref:S ribonuclease n=1 Tax=Pyrus ussuriensis x Pyrus communis TaxID=2448454 RepID=A0A5N5GB77_9ROSA|nr:S ribonuclease [Pyrus ussuriensis x Pyrus communis]
MDNAKQIKELVEQRSEDDDDDFVDPPLKGPKAKKAKASKKLVLQHKDPEEDETVGGPKQVAKKDECQKGDVDDEMISVQQQEEDDDERTISDVLMTKLARKGNFEPFRAFLGLLWITCIWSKVDGRICSQKRLGTCYESEKESSRQRR